MGMGIFSPQLMGSGLGLMEQLRPPKSSGLMDMLMGTQGGAGAFPAAPTPSYGERLSSRLQDLLDPSVALPMAGAMIAGATPGESFGNALGFAGQGLGELKKARAGEEQHNRAMAFLQSKRPDLAEAVQAGMPISEAWSQALGGGDKPTDDMREYNRAVEQGFSGTLMDYKRELKKAGADNNNITVGGGRYGTIPPGYELVEGPQGATLRAIPGGPEDTSKKDELKAGQADIATRVVTTAAQRAREAAKNRNFGSVGQGVVERMPWTDSAEVARQTEVLKSTAKIENLNAMRQASPTGGALGSVTEQETNMLAAKSGALDPNSPTFERDLDDYELTLLQIVHGPAEGQRIFEATRDGAQSAAPGAGNLAWPSPGGTTSGGVQWSVSP